MALEIDCLSTEAEIKRVSLLVGFGAAAATEFDPKNGNGVTVAAIIAMGPTTLATVVRLHRAVQRVK